ncbi:ATP-binding cassette domain-containing protein [Salmonella enterica]|uniref:ATP-binding cassette domain-containing protein n=1 Tax=Salmonella enterica TaxID=28901 RepID=UPI001CA4F0BC|nr:ATP-binding cassette domain-containing protein [Salmonella enterica]
MSLLVGSPVVLGSACVGSVDVAGSVVPGVSVVPPPPMMVVVEPAEQADEPAISVMSASPEIVPNDPTAPNVRMAPSSAEKTRDRKTLGLSGGEQKQLEIARGLLLEPQLVLIDEPSIGLSPLMVQQTFDMLKQLRDRGVSVLLIEQNARSALEISDYGEQRCPSIGEWKTNCGTSMQWITNL